MAGRLAIDERCFDDGERTVLQYEGLEAVLFTYGSGVRAVRLVNDRGHAVILPYLGQMIWDAEFAGRRLTMGSLFDQPKPTDLFLHTYGCFMMHCGALRMGCPGPDDSHALHGELPCARYRDVEIGFGTDGEGSYLSISGTYEHDVAFTAHYRARPEVRIRMGSTLIDITMRIENRSRYAMELMYMGHINFRPVDGGRIVQSLPWDSEHMVLRTSIPEHVTVSRQFLDFMAKVEKEPSLTSVLNPGVEYRPEMAIFMNGPRTDDEGLSHFMQLHPDGTADYVGFAPELMDHPTRWIMRTGEQEALGIALPSTCDPEGYTAEKRKGNIKEIPGNASAALVMRTGVLERDEAAAMERRIEKARG
jgi:hypothetical protein